MAAKKRGLGRGLDALLSGSLASADQPSEQDSKDALINETDDVDKPVASSTPNVLPVDLIQRSSFQPRRDFNPVTLQELADSIAAQGVVQPIVVRPIAAGRYEIIAGERRWRACQQAGLHEIPVVIRPVSDQIAFAMSLIENIQRDDLNPLEEALALQRLADEFSLTHQQVAQAVGKSRSAVTNLLRLLDLNEEVKDLFFDGQIETGHAKALLALPSEKQTTLAQEIADTGLTVRETEKRVRQLLGQDLNTKEQKSIVEDPNIRQLQDHLTERLGANVKIQQNTTGKGKLVIAYNTLEELDGILNRIH